MTTKDKLQFALSLGRHTKATVRQVQELLRYAGTLKQLAADDYERRKVDVNDRYNDKKRLRIANKIGDICEQMSLEERLEGQGDPKRIILPLFSGPRLKIRVPSGEEICVPS